jgi:dTDP-4-amino-4,6-dideoxygalactose transaminase
VNIPFNDFTKEYHAYKSEIDQAISRVLESGWYILGEETKQLEEELARYLNVTYCVTVANGTEAIALALMALGVGQGDEVITTNMTAYPTIVGIEQAGATPVVVDIDGKTGLINSSLIEEKITSRTKAIVPVHMYGQSCQMDKILEIAKGHNLKVMEDCAQSIGAKYQGKTTGTFGDAGSLSFYPTKNLGAIGDAGAIITNNKDVYSQLLKLRNYGQSVRYYHDVKGINSRLDELQAAILRVKLSHLDENIAKRRKIAEFYTKHITVPFVPESTGNFHTYHLFILKSDRRDEFMSFLKEHGVASIIHYPVPINQQKAFSQQKNEKFPVTEEFTSTVFSIPIYPELTEEEITYIAKTVNSFSTK